MQQIPYKTKSGKTRFKFKMSEDEYTSLRNGLDDPGMCRYCGDQAYGVEPDARAYECDGCGAFGVYGIDEFLISGLLEISGDA